MNKDLEKKKDAVWKQWESKLGKRILPNVRARFEADLETDIDEEVYVADLDDLMKENLEKFKLLFDEREYFSHRKKPNVTSTKRYQRCFERRVYLVKFIMGRNLATHNSKRINWKQLCIDWNEAHPNDTFHPKVIKVRYYRALAEPEIRKIYFEETIARELEKLVEFFGDALKAAPVIDLVNMALRDIDEADQMENDDEANAKYLHSRETLARAVALIRQEKVNKVREFQATQERGIQAAMGAIPELKDFSIKSLADLVTVDFQGFITLIQKGGRTKEKEQLLTWMTFTPQEIDQIFQKEAQNER